MVTRLVLVFALAVMFGAPTLASAQQGGADLRIGAGAVLDFAGQVEAEYGYGADDDDDMNLTPGLRLHLDYDVHRYVSVGGLVRTSWWRSDDYWTDRSFLMDFMFRVAGHYDWRDFRFYVALTIGPTLSVFNEDQLIGDAFDNPAVGVAAGLTPGAEWWFARHAGLFLEMFGWNGHFFSHEFERSNLDADFRINQVSWQLGIVFAP